MSAPLVYVSDDGRGDDVWFLSRLGALEPRTRWLVIDATRLSRLTADPRWLEHRRVLDGASVAVLVRDDLDLALDVDGVEIVPGGRRTDAARRLLGPERWIAATDADRTAAVACDPMLVDVLVSSDPPGARDADVVWWVRVETTDPYRRPPSSAGHPNARAHGVFRTLQVGGNERDGPA